MRHVLQEVREVRSMASIGEPNLPATEYGIRLRSTEYGVQTSLGRSQRGMQTTSTSWKRTYPKRPIEQIFVDRDSRVNVDASYL